MRFLSLIIKSSLRTTKIIKSNFIIKQQIIKFCTVNSNQINLIDALKKDLTNEEQEKIKNHLLECNTNTEDWKHELTVKMIKIHMDKEYDFGNLENDKIELLLNDFQKLKDKKLAIPKCFSKSIIEDLSKVWEDDKSRFHMLAFIGIKQFKKFKILCDKQIKRTFELKLNIEKKNEDKKIIDHDEQVYRDSVYYKKNRMNYYHHFKMMNTVFEGQNLILDFSLTDNCLNSEYNSIVSQTQRIVKHNLDSDQPFNLWFTSLQKNSSINQLLSKQNILSPKNFINLKEQHYIELFDKDQLIYLSPDAEQTIDKFDNKAIYILGAIVDRYSDEPLTFNSSKKYNIKSYKLPLEKYVLLSSLATDLSFYSVFQMLNYMQLEYATWDNCFKQFLRQDRRVDELELIKKFNPNLISKKEIDKYNRKSKYQYKYRLFNRIQN